MKIIGHRGAKGLAPENTIAGFRAAIDHGVDGIEFDVRTTRDNIPVIIHNAALETADGSEFSVHMHTLEELQARQPELCTLSAALRAINRRVPAFIEIKPGADPEPIVTVIRKLQVEGWTAADITFLSFDFRVLKVMHAAFPEIPIIVNDMWSSVRAVRRARALGTKQVDIFYRVLWPGVIRGLTRHGYQVYTFALNDAAQVRRWQQAGLYGVVTDFPDRMQSLRGPHNPWQKDS